MAADSEVVEDRPNCRFCGHTYADHATLMDTEEGGLCFHYFEDGEVCMCMVYRPEVKDG